MLEFLHSHTSVVSQPDYDDRRYNGINPYALGYAMMEDIKRICLTPTDEDRQWFPDIAGNDDPYGTPARRLGELSGRELHPAVPQPEPDAQVPPVPECATTRPRPTCASTRSMTRPATGNCARPWRAAMTCPGASRTSRWSNWTWPATARWSCATRSTTACCWMKRPARWSCVTWSNCGGYPVRMIETDAVTDAVLKTHNLAPGT